MTLVSRYIRYMQIFAGVPRPSRGGASDKGGVRKRSYFLALAY